MPPAILPLKPLPLVRPMTFERKSAAAKSLIRFSQHLSHLACNEVARPACRDSRLPRASGGVPLRKRPPLAQASVETSLTAFSEEK